MHMSEINTDRSDLLRFVFLDIIVSICRVENKLNLRMCAKEEWIVQVKDIQSMVDLNIKAIESNTIWI
jgi:hypothetical protein